MTNDRCFLPSAFCLLFLQNGTILPYRSAPTSVVRILPEAYDSVAFILFLLRSRYPLITLKSEQRADQSLEGHLPFGRTHNGKSQLALERRGRLRSSQPLRARVWGVDINDEAVSYDCQVANISSSGAYLMLPRAMAFSSDISLAVHLEGADGNVTAAIKGTVVRVEMRPDFQHGIAVKTSRYSFL